MTSSEQTLTTFQTRVRQMILRFQELKKENEELYQMVDQNEKDIKNLRDRLEQKSNDYDSLKMAKMMEITNGDLEQAKNRLARLVRDVNKCIAILTEQK
ncbi:MAG: hypothetical protein J6K19_08875 [Prevotella sp.]|nr:hypothetical protein [Prevotella sp.]